MSVRSHTHCSPPRNRSMIPSRVGSASARNSAAARSRSLSVVVAMASNISKFLDESRLELFRRPRAGGPEQNCCVQGVIARDADELAEIAADVFRDRVRARPDLVIALPAGRTPRRIYRRVAALQARAPGAY